MRGILQMRQFTQAEVNGAAMSHHNAIEGLFRRDSHPSQRLRRGARQCLLSLALLIGGAQLAAAQMTLPGKFAIDDNGSATYKIAIAVPPGTAGMAPSLSLDYNNRLGNGIVGVGWTLSGLPSVG